MPSAERCSPWTRRHGVDPIGSAGTYGSVLLIEVPQPWPDDVSRLPLLAEVSAADPGRRVLAVVPRESDDSGLVRLIEWSRRAATRFEGADVRLEPAELDEALGVLAAGARVADRPDATQPPAELLICAHGRRDPCCGKRGTRLGTEVASRWDGMRVWRCSHTGGHRFAPTGITFPDGRVWAHLDVDVLDAVVGRAGEPTDLRMHYRGGLGLDPWAQAVERELFCAEGWSWLDCDVVSATTDLASEGRSATVEIDWSGPQRRGRATATVEVGRDVPVLVCGLDESHAKKSSPELRVTSFEQAVVTP